MSLSPMKYVDICVALYDYRSQNDDELTFKAHDIFYIHNKETPDWYKAQAVDHSVGYIPSNYIEKKTPIGSVKAIYDYQAGSIEELDFKEDETMVLYEKDDPDWYLAKNQNGEFGLVPSNYVKSESRWALALYAFVPTDVGELALEKGEQVMVMDYDGEDWWTVKKADGKQGLVPSSYVKFREDEDVEQSGKKETHLENKEKLKGLDLDRFGELDQEIRAEAVKHRVQREQEKKSKLDEESKFRAQKEQEEKSRQAEEAKYRAQKEQEEKEKSRQAEVERRRQAQEVARQQRELEAKLKQAGARQQNDLQKKVQVVEPLVIRNGMSLDPSKPNPEKTRWWTDNTGAFKVEAQLISCIQGKVRLFKTNGVKIEVPANKMCDDDLMYIERETGQRIIKDSTPLPQSSGKLNWFNYFKRLNMPHEASAAYTQAFERENLNEQDLESLTYTKLKSLGMAENHIRQLQRFIETHQVEPSFNSESNRPQLRKIKKKVTFGSVDYIRDGAFIEVSDNEETEYGEHNTQWQIEQDAKLARMLQEEEDQHSKAAPSVGLQRRDTARPPHYSPEILQPTPVHSQRPAATTTPLASISGFADDAWTPRPGPSSIPPQLPQRPKSTQALNTINSHLSNTQSNPTAANIMHTSNQNISPYHQNYTQPNQNIYSYQQTHIQPNQNIVSYQQTHIQPNHSGASLHHTPPLHYTNFSPVPSAPTQPLQPAFGNFHTPLQPQMTTSRSWAAATPDNPFGINSNNNNLQHIDPTDKYAIFKTINTSTPTILKTSNEKRYN
ncbi:unnamed protein product [Rhizopus stolonifer]